MSMVYTVLFLLVGCEDRARGGGARSGTAASGTAMARPPGGPLPPLPGNGVQSGAALQDPTGFPLFHGMPAPAGRIPSAPAGFGAPIVLAARPEGGYRPQVAVGPNDVLHAVYYDRVATGDVVRYRTSPDGATWAAPETVSPTDGRNWGPDIVVRPEGTVVVAYDHAEADFRSRGWIRSRTPAGWTDGVAVTPDGARESGSGHVAGPDKDDLAYVYIGKSLGPTERFRATWTWFRDGVWSSAAFFSDGTADAWHTNVKRRPDGSVLAAYDIGQGGMEATLFVVDGRDGTFGAPENLTSTSYPGERANFAFQGAVDWITWFHRAGGVPTRVYVRSGQPGAWGPTSEPSAGYGGFHFDPDIAVAPDGTGCLVWGWDAGDDAEIVYALNRGAGWDPPRKVADVDWGKPGLPSVEADSRGAFHVVWTQGVRGSNEVYYARLDPGARP